MKKLYRKCIRPCGRWSDVFPLAVLIAVTLVYTGTLLAYIVSLLVSNSGISEYLFEKPAVLITPSGTLSIGNGTAEFLQNYLIFAGIWVVVIAVVLIFRRNRPMLRCLGKRTGGKTFLTALIGLLLGFGTNGICILISVLTGDIHLSFNEFNPALFFIFLLAVTIQSGAEELAMRWYLYQKLRRRYHHAVFAMIVNSIVFTAMHLLNPGITFVSILEIAFVGMLMSLLIYYYDGFWMTVFFHAAWNFTQNIVFGLPNSGIVSEYSVFRLEAASARDGFFYNTAFGVEGSVGSVIILALCCAVLIIINRKKREKRDVWAAVEQSLA